MQAPAATPVAVLPDTEQVAGVVELNVTAKPELAVALNPPVPPTTNVGAAPKVMLWLASPTVIDWFTGGAAL